MIAYHITLASNIKSIKKTMTLKKGVVGNDPDKSGDGIYIILDTDHSAIDNMRCYLFPEEHPHQVAIVKVDVDPNSLLMDEDSLYDQYIPGLPFCNNGEVDRNERLKILSKYMPLKAAEIYDKYCDDGDEPAVDGSGPFKVKLIDKFKIRPHPDIQIDAMRHRVRTARCIDASIKVLDIKICEEEDEEDEIKDTDLPS